MYTYTVYQLQNGILKNKEYLNDIDEVNSFIDNCIYPTIQIIQDQTNKYRTMTCIDSFKNKYKTIDIGVINEI